MDSHERIPHARRAAGEAAVGRIARAMDNGNHWEGCVRVKATAKRKLTPDQSILQMTAKQARTFLLKEESYCSIDLPVYFTFEAVIAEPELVKLVQGSPGSNFGSVHLGAGFTTWPPGRNPIGAQRDQAAEVFAFDTLIQNADRRAVNPNLWARSDKLGVYDHEQAFSFLSLPIIGGVPKPWTAASQGNGFRFLEQHVFYGNLRGGRLNLGPFKEKLGALSDKRIQGEAGQDGGKAGRKENRNEGLPIRLPFRVEE